MHGFPLSVSSAFTETFRGKLEKAFWTQQTIDRQRLSESFRRKIDHVLKILYFLARVKARNKLYSAVVRLDYELSLLFSSGIVERAKRDRA